MGRRLVLAASLVYRFLELGLTLRVTLVLASFSKFSGPTIPFLAF